MLTRILLAPIPGDASGADVGGSSGVPTGSPPAPTSSPATPPAPRLPYVPPPSDDAPPASQPPAQGAPPSGAPGGPPAQPQDNPIPYSRVQQMLARERERVAQQVRQEFERQPRGRDPNETIAIVKQALKLAGIEVPEEQPRAVSPQEVSQFVEHRFQQMEQQFAARSEYERGVRELSAAKQQHAEVFAAFPALEKQAQALWGADSSRSMTEIVNELVQGLEGYYSARSASYGRQKLADRGAAPVRPQGALGGVRPPQHDLATPDGMDAALDELLGQPG